MRFAFKTSPQNTTWADMLAVWQEADGIEIFESGWTFDHFYPIFSDPAGPCLEGWMTLAALAQATQRLRLGTLVTGIHYRHPAAGSSWASVPDGTRKSPVPTASSWAARPSAATGLRKRVRSSSAC